MFGSDSTQLVSAGKCSTCWRLIEPRQMHRAPTQPQTSAKGAAHTSLGQRPRFGVRKTGGLKARSKLFTLSHSTCPAVTTTTWCRAFSPQNRSVVNCFLGRCPRLV
jgi:hypothetical protein